eukprot:6183782-Pleurochrysis_carterae.AAC.3
MGQLSNCVRHNKHSKTGKEERDAKGKESEACKRGKRNENSLGHARTKDRGGSGRCYRDKRIPQQGDSWEDRTAEAYIEYSRTTRWSSHMRKSTQDTGPDLETLHATRRDGEWPTHTYVKRGYKPYERGGRQEAHT